MRTFRIYTAGSPRSRFILNCFTETSRSLSIVDPWAGETVLAAWPSVRPLCPHNLLARAVVTQGGIPRAKSGWLVSPILQPGPAFVVWPGSHSYFQTIFTVLVGYFLSLSTFDKWVNPGSEKITLLAQIALLIHGKTHMRISRGQWPIANKTEVESEEAAVQTRGR